MAYYRECPTCGAHLDPGERCMDCADRAAKPGTKEAGVGADRIKPERPRPLMRAAGAGRIIRPVR